MKIPQPLLILTAYLLVAYSTRAQQKLALKDAIQQAIDNYGIVKSKGQYAIASEASAEQAQRDYLPNLNVGLQRDYGTINGQNGPSYRQLITKPSITPYFRWSAFPEPGLGFFKLVRYRSNGIYF